MALKFQKLLVEKVVQETPDAISIWFRNPDREVYKYIPGQYLTLKVIIDDKPYNRAFSLSSCPVKDNNLIVTVKITPGGKVSTSLVRNLKAGQEIEVMPPLGNFTAPMDAAHRNHYVLIGAGSGITPLMSILRSALESEPQSKITLLFGNRSENDIIFKSTLSELITKHPERLKVIHSLSQSSEDWRGENGRLTQSHILEILGKQQATDGLRNEYYVCGPAGMMLEAANAVKSLGVAPPQLHEEHFGAHLNHGTEDEPTPVKIEAKAEDISSIDDVTIVLDDKEYTFKVKNGQSILDAALDADLDPPYACMIGSCCTCKAKLLSGKIIMDDREGLTDSEIAEGFVLTCQSHPTSKGVKVSYDAL